MQLISLNTFGGCFLNPFLDFVKKNATNTDIFCFQEVLDTPETEATEEERLHQFSELTKILPDFQGFFAPAQDHDDPITKLTSVATLGLATFVRKKYSLQSNGDFFICNKRNSFVRPDSATFPHNLHYIQLPFAGTLLTVCNLHGISKPDDKLDSPERLQQSQKVLDFAQEQPGEKIICGDFNLFPETESILMFEKNGFDNLIKNFNVKTTRGSLIKKMHPEYGTGPNGWQEYADYVLTTSGVRAVGLSVPDLPLSDHLPMLLTFELTA